MSRVLVSGWEMNSTDGSDGGIWTSTNGLTSASNVYSGSYSGRIYAAVGASVRFSAYIAVAAYTGDLYIEFRFYPVVATSGNILSMTDTGSGGGTNCQIKMATVSTQYYLRLFNDTTQQGSDIGPISLSTWYRIGLKYINSTRALTLYVDGIEGATGTANASYDNPNYLYVGWTGTQTGDLFYDDLIIDNAVFASAGTTDGGRIIQLGADGDGNRDTGETQPTRGGSDSGSDWGQVDENPPNDATDYIIFDTNDEALPVTLTAATSQVPSGDLIRCVAVNCRERAASAASEAWRRKIRGSSGTWAELDLANVTHNNITWMTNGNVAPKLQAFSTTDPDTSVAWTRTGLDSAQISLLGKDTNPAIWLTSLWALVEHYTAPAVTGKVTIGAENLGGSGRPMLVGG